MIPRLDIPTLLYGAIAVEFGLTVAMLTAMRLQGTYPGFGYWTVAAALRMVAWPLLGLQGTAPDIISKVLPNLLLLTSAELVYRGVLAFINAKRGAVFDIVLYSVFFALFIYFIYGRPDLAARIVIMFWILAYALLKTSITLFHGLPAGYRRERLLVVWSTGLWGGILFLRGVDALFEKGLGNSLITAVPNQAWVFVMTWIFTIITTCGILLLNNRRLQLELEDARVELEGLARTDSLTGVLTRREVMARAARQFALARRHDRPLSALLIDCDRFNEINDKYGHHVGDIVLKEVTTLISTSVRGEDMVGRLGGEEFVVYLPDTTLHDAEIVAEKIRRTVAEAVIAAETWQLGVSVSIGVSARGPEDPEVGAITRRCDAAMYAAKNAGRNRVRVHVPGVAMISDEVPV